MARGLLSSFRKTFITGLIILLPLLVTVFLLSMIVKQLNKQVTPYITNFLKIARFPFLDSPVYNYLAPAVSLIITVLVISLIGMLATNIIGKRLLTYFDDLMLRIPIVKAIYGAAKQLLDALRAPGSRSFQKVVLVEYPRKGVYVIGFLVNEVDGNLETLVPGGLVNVFIPTTPNPTSGFLLLVPMDEIISLNIPIDIALKHIVSGGLVSRTFEIKKGV